MKTEIIQFIVFVTVAAIIMVVCYLLHVNPFLEGLLIGLIGSAVDDMVGEYLKQRK